MSRLHSSIAYDILHGINISSNVSRILAYLSYFPPPPPVIPGPPPRRSWTCSAYSLSPSSCFISDEFNPPNLRPFIYSNQSFLSKNTSVLSKDSNETFKSSSIFSFFQNQLTFILLFIIFLSIFIFVILLILLFLYIKRIRQRQLLSNNHNQSDNNNNIELNNKNKKFYYHLIPYREKHQKQIRRNINDDNNLSRLTNHESPVLEVKRLSKTSVIHINNNNQEQEEAL